MLNVARLSPAFDMENDREIALFAQDWPLDADLADATGNLVPGKYFSNDSSAPVFEPGMKGSALAINQSGEAKNMQRVGHTDLQGRPFVYNPSPTVAGSSISHWDTAAAPNLLMEPAINPDLLVRRPITDRWRRDLVRPRVQ